MKKGRCRTLLATACLAMAQALGPFGSYPPNPQNASDLHLRIRTRPANHTLRRPPRYSILLDSWTLDVAYYRDTLYNSYTQTLFCKTTTLCKRARNRAMRETTNRIGHDY